jgi:hypothetical protein
MSGMGAARAPDRLGRSVRWWHGLVVVACVGAVIAPVVRNRDSFPLSTYPMYAGRGTRIETLATAVGIDASGAERRLSLASVAATDDPLIAESLVSAAIGAGRADALCTQIAARVRGPLVRVEVVEERHDLVARAKHEASLLERHVHAACEVPR